MEKSPAERPQHRSSLLVQIAVALALVGTVPLALAVWQLVGVNRDALFEQLLRTHTASARTTADAIDGFLAGRRTLAGALTSDRRLLDDPTSAEAQALLRDSLAAWTEAGVAGLGLFDASGELVLSVRTKDEAEIVDAVLARAPAEGVRIVGRDGAPWAAIALPLVGAAGSLALVVDARPVARALAPEELGAEARRLLFERNGAAVWGTSVGASDLAPQLASAAFSGNLSGAGRFREPDGREIVAAWSSADAGRWIVISAQPGAIAEATAARMARRSIVAVMASLLFVALLSLGAWSRLVRPLRALLAAQRAEAGGIAEVAPVRSETAELEQALLELERRARDRAALDTIFLGRYQVLALVGSGGMGSVFRGWDPRLQRTVALKTIRIAIEGGPVEHGSKLLEEAIAAARIAHPNVVGVFDAEESSEAAFVAMELIDGIGLDKYLERRGRLDWREVVPLGAAIASGLAAAHARGIVHRDIKPGNILLGHDGAIKIADFGLATYLHRLHETPGKVFGTPGFLSPEALLGMPIDARADLYATGVVLYRAATGRFPFRGASLRELVASTVGTPSPRANEIDPALPQALSELIAALLEKDPEQRLAPASEVARRFELLARENSLSWRLDYAAGSPATRTSQHFEPVTVPTVRLDADLA